MWNWGRKRQYATARHILVNSHEQCEKLKLDIENGASFAEVAKEHSNCPSAKHGGDLGEFRSGQMVKPFNDVVFSAALNQLHGPVKTRFGYHLIEIISRSDAK